MADVIYNNFKGAIMDGTLNLDSDTVKVMLVTDSYTPDQDIDTTFGDVTNEVTGSGYTAGGSDIPNTSVTVDNTDNEGVFNGSDVTWADSTLTARAAVIYDATSSGSELVCYIDFTEDKTSTSGNFTISWNAEGILNLN